LRAGGGARLVWPPGWASSSAAGWSRPKSTHGGRAAR
jgi:hypothetical protein